MALTIELAPAAEGVLRDAAARRGLRPEEYARELLEQNLPQHSGTASTSEGRARAFEEWVASHKDITAVVLDDSREAIYAEDESRF